MGRNKKEGSSTPGEVVGRGAPRRRLRERSARQTSAPALRKSHAPACHNRGANIPKEGASPPARARAAKASETAMRMGKTMLSTCSMCRRQCPRRPATRRWRGRTRRAAGKGPGGSGCLPQSRCSARPPPAKAVAAPERRLGLQQKFSRWEGRLSGVRGREKQSASASFSASRVAGKSARERSGRHTTPLPRQKQAQQAGKKARSPAAALGAAHKDQQALFHGAASPRRAASGANRARAAPNPKVQAVLFHQGAGRFPARKVCCRRKTAPSAVCQHAI